VPATDISRMSNSSSGHARWRVAIWAGIATVALAAIVNGVVSERWREYRDRTSRSEAVIVALDAHQSSLADAETGQRGFLLTGEPDYLAPFTAARTAVQRDVSHLRSLAESSDVPVADVDRLTALSADKMRELDSTVALRQANRGDLALAIVRTNRGKALMDSVRALTRSLLRNETARLDGRRHEEDRSGGVVLVALLAGAAATLGILAYLLQTLNDYDATQRAAQREMQLQMADLESLARARFSTNVPSAVTESTHERRE
jgi:CHASE3 domain sensor protein